MANLYKAYNVVIIPFSNSIWIKEIEMKKELYKQCLNNEKSFLGGIKAFFRCF